MNKPIKREWARASDLTDKRFISIKEQLQTIGTDVRKAEKRKIKAITSRAFDMDSPTCHTRQWEWPWAAIQMFEHLSTIKDHKPRLTTLDVGSSFRPFTIYLQQFSDVLAIDDSSYPFLEDFSTLLPKYGASFLPMNAAETNFADGMFDYTFIISMLEHTSRATMDAILAEAQRVTKHLVICTIDKTNAVAHLLPGGVPPEDVLRTPRGKNPVAGFVFKGGSE